MTPTKSQVLSANPHKVLDLLDQWVRTVDTLEQQVETYKRYVDRPGGSYWEGKTAEAARVRAGEDCRAVVNMRAAAMRAIGQIRNTVTSRLMPPLSNAQQIIANAEAQPGVTVHEDLSITYIPPEGMNPITAEANSKVVAEAAAELKESAEAWWAAENQVAQQIHEAQSLITDEVSFASTTPQAARPHIQTVDNHNFKESPQQPLPGDPAGMTPEQARTAYDQLKGEIRGHNSRPPPLNDAGAVDIYNREAETLNARKAALEAQLGKTETVPAQGTRLVPDWAQPWHPPENTPTPVPHGPGTWQQVTESMSDRAAQYQMQITGHPITDGYIVSGVKFDGFANGALIDAKSFYAQFTQNGQFMQWWAASPTGGEAVISQAARQLAAAGGIPIQWYVAEPEALSAFRQLLSSRGMSGIQLVLAPPK
ncbi:Tox-REase-5 domain-containing protein [Mycobacterium sp. TY815]|uniref:Tox-REase-5 domain-containing protein n=1 Tax=Mycobacterium TaxID=1763 RepID=UPI0027409D63|nr:Tox-REase-5 domain-containing protein [Mycobacterium sp. TY815]MDP7707557.1 Tox-REase-5 domain-containing protein [Mycobacterium sp. TY815]